MKKFVLALLAAFAVFGMTLTSCEMTYDKEYPELIQYYCCWGDDEWNAHDKPTLTLMQYVDGKYEIEVETERRNQRFEITKGATYDIEYMYDHKGVCSADDETISAFPKVKDNNYGSLQTVLPTPGKYLITFDANTEKYHVEAK